MNKVIETTKRNQPLLNRSTTGYDLKRLFESFNPMAELEQISIKTPSTPEGWEYKEVRDMALDFKSFLFANNITKCQYRKDVKHSIDYEKGEGIYIVFEADQNEMILWFEEDKFFDYIKRQEGFGTSSVWNTEVKAFIDFHGWKHYAIDYVVSSVVDGEWIKSM